MPLRNNIQLSKFDLVAIVFSMSVAIQHPTDIVIFNALFLTFQNEFNLG